MTSADVLAANPWMTFRQFDHWCRKGWVRPDNPNAGSGRARSFSRTEVRVLKRMALLVAGGVATSVAAGMARAEVEKPAPTRRPTGTGWPEAVACR
jgi:hypothetical protein